MPAGHEAAAAMARAGLVAAWVQLGHDGLALKAGFSPEACVEVYDSW